MIFRDTTTARQGMVDQTLFLTSSDIDSFPLEDITRLSNIALDAYFDMAMENNNDWKLDDISYSDYTIATTNLVSGQIDYAMPADLIDVVSIKIKDANGDWHQLEQYREQADETPTETRFQTNGLPENYQKRGDGIFLLPATNYNSTGGLKIEYKRIANYYLTTDTTKQAGIPKNHHRFIPLFVAHQYGIGRTLANYALIENELEKMKRDIKIYWARRGKEKPSRIKPYIANTR